MGDQTKTEPDEAEVTAQMVLLLQDKGFILITSNLGYGCKGEGEKGENAMR